MSYIYMKILEKCPEKYEKGINILSLAHARGVREYIVKTCVEPDIKMLDIGCGTGALIIDAAKAGANVVGIDSSERMLTVARNRIEEEDLESEIELNQASVDEMDTLFDDNSFDLVTSTLVFSELYGGERRWALEQVRRVLKESGIFVLADEVEPRGLLKKVLYFVIRLPLALITYIIAQGGTETLPDIIKELSGAGFEIIDEKRSFLDSFAIISAKIGRADSKTRVHGMGGPRWPP